MDTPMKSFTAERRRPTVWDALVALCVLSLAGVLAFVVLPRGTAEQLTAVITVDGGELDELPLYPPYTEKEPVQYSLENLPYPLVLEYKTGAIRVLEYECPGGDCARIGWITQAGQQIICLPNRLVITLTGHGSQSYDAITG